MEKRDIIVIGASSGGFEAIKSLVRLLPGDLGASVFVVWHMSPDMRGVLPQVLNRYGNLQSAHAIDGEQIHPNRIYVAPPDRHLLIDHGLIRLTRGPKENRFRPAVDPLFRSAAFNYGPRVIGVVLSGALDDGTAGLWTIKYYGGLAVVQDPAEAEFPSMPENAIKEVNIDHRVRIAEMAPLLVQLCSEHVSEKYESSPEEDHKTNTELSIALQKLETHREVLQLGELTPYTCPECHGVLAAIKDGHRVRFRCHTGHAFSADSLISALTENIEDSLWTAIRGIQESIVLLNSLGDYYSSLNQPKTAAVYFQKAKEAGKRVAILKAAVFDHEQLSIDRITQMAQEKKKDIERPKEVSDL